MIATCAALSDGANSARCEASPRIVFFVALSVAVSIGLVVATSLGRRIATTALLPLLLPVFGPALLD